MMPSISHRRRIFYAPLPITTRTLTHSAISNASSATRRSPANAVVGIATAERALKNEIERVRELGRKNTENT